MNWRTIRYALLLLLVALNLGLLGYSIYLNVERYVVPQERIDLLREQYKRKGYILPESIPRSQYPKERMRLARNNLESRADAFWDAEYEKSYMIGSKILYTCGDETLTVDRDTSSMVYAQAARSSYLAGSEEEQDRAKEFAVRMMQNEDLLLLTQTEKEDESIVYTFCEVYKETLVFSNIITVTMHRGAVLQAEMTQYIVEGYDSEEQYIYPVDEVLSLCLRELNTAEEEELNLYYGYFLQNWEDGSGFAVPCIMVLLQDGSGLLADQYTVSISSLQY